MSTYVAQPSATFSTIPDEDWAVYERVLSSLQHDRITFAVGGGLAKLHYTGVARGMKDLDIYVLREDRDAAIESLTRAGMSDYFTRQPYDRKWIYRSSQNDNIVDIIWAMANQRAQVDAVWLHHGPEVEARGKSFRLVPPEEILWAALYVMQRSRCDWPDALNLLYAQAGKMEWARLVDRLSEDLSVLVGLLHVFLWLCPERRPEIPLWVFDRLSETRVEDRDHGELGRTRAARLDTCPWFLPTLGAEP